MTKRLFVSTDYEELYENTSLGEKTDGIDDLESYDICHWDSSNHKIEKGFDNHSDLFFIKDSLEKFPPEIIINKNEDYILWHNGKTKGTITGEFDEAKTRGGHHGGLNHVQEDFKYYAIVLDTLLNKEVPDGQKVEMIIQKIWPDLKAREELASLVLDRTKIKEENDIVKFVEKLNAYYNSYPKNNKTTQP